MKAFLSTHAFPVECDDSKRAFTGQPFRSPSENGGEAVGLRVVPEEHHAVPRNAVVEAIPSVNQSLSFKCDSNTEICLDKVFFLTQCLSLLRSISMAFAPSSSAAAVAARVFSQKAEK